MKKAKQKFTYGVGKRRTASVRVRLYKGKGEDKINNQNMENYFAGLFEKDIWKRPFELTETRSKYYVSARGLGGGKKGQLEATALGISRALIKADPEKFKPVLRKAGLLTRDARVRERRKVGTGGKARRKKQSPKR